MNHGIESPSWQVVLVADADASRGAGHVMRSLTLGSALLRLGINPVLWTSELPPVLNERAEALGVAVNERTIDLNDPRMLQELLLLQPDLTVLDSYSFDATTLNQIDSSGMPVVVVDDNRETVLRRPLAVVNQNIHAFKNTYRDVSPELGLLLGPRYCLIRDEIRKVRDDPPTRSQSQVVVALGGSDVLGLTETIVRELEARGHNVESVRGFLGRNRARQAGHLPELLATSAIAVIGAGTTVWEAACLGTPTVAVILAANQEQIAKSAQQAHLGLAVDGRRALPVSEIIHQVEVLLEEPQTRAQMSVTGQALVDGHGADRVAGRLHSWLLNR